MRRLGVRAIKINNYKIHYNVFYIHFVGKINHPVGYFFMYYKCINPSWARKLRERSIYGSHKGEHTSKMYAQGRGAGLLYEALR